MGSLVFCVWNRCLTVHENPSLGGMNFIYPRVLIVYELPVMLRGLTHCVTFA